MYLSTVFFVFISTFILPHSAVILVRRHDGD